MNKPFLLIAGDNYHPQSGMDDWIARFDTYDEAASEITEDKFGNYVIRYIKYDWYEIVNLETVLL